MPGIKRRLQRLFDQESGKSIILPIDHGVSEGLIPGLENTAELISSISQLPVQGIVMHNGIARSYSKFMGVQQGLIVHLSGGSKHAIPPYIKSQICSVQEAMRSGADAVSVHLNFGNDFEDRMLSDTAMIIEEAHQAGLPVMTMIYARGGQIVKELDSSLIAHSIRLGTELGADLIKVPYSGDQESFARAVQSCPAPVLVAGGPRQPDFDSFLTMIEQALQCGVSGVSTGRNIFQSQDPAQCISSLAKIIHNRP